MQRLSSVRSQAMLPLCTAVLVVASASGCTPISRQTGVFQPQSPGYAYQDGMLLHQGRPILRVVQTDVDTYTTNYQLTHQDGAVEASITFASSYDNTLESRAEFPSLGVHYEARIPIIPFTTLLASYLDNGVLVADRINAQGLAAYAQSRGIQLVDTGAQMQRLHEAGSIAICRNCVEDYRRCQVQASQARENPAPGVTYSTSCETQFQECSQGGILTRQDEWPCGAPPP